MVCQGVFNRSSKVRVAVEREGISKRASNFCPRIVLIEADCTSGLVKVFYDFDLTGFDAVEFNGGPKTCLPHPVKGFFFYKPQRGLLMLSVLFTGLKSAQVLSLNPASSSALVSSSCGFNISTTTLKRLCQSCKSLIILQLWHCNLFSPSPPPFPGEVLHKNVFKMWAILRTASFLIADWQLGACRVFLPSWTSPARKWSTPAAFVCFCFFQWLHCSFYFLEKGIVTVGHWWDDEYDFRMSWSSIRQKLS